MSDERPSIQPEEPEPVEPMLETEPSELSLLAGDAESSDDRLLIPIGDYQPDEETEQRHSMIMVNTITLVTTSVVALGIVWVLYGRLSGVHNSIGRAVLWVCIVAVVGLTIMHCLLVYSRLRKRVPHPSTFAIHINPYGKRISDRSLNALRHTFLGEHGHDIEREQVVHLVTRKHWAYAVKCMRLPLTLLVAYLGLTMWLAIVTQVTSHLSSWLFVLILVALVAWCGIGFLRWRAWYFVVTDRYTRIIVQYPPHVWWMHEKVSEVKLSRIDVGKATNQRIFGDLLGYGVAGGDTRSSEDVDFHHLDYMPQYLVVNNLLLELGSG
jgi:hypothetical protein